MEHLGEGGYDESMKPLLPPSKQPKQKEISLRKIEKFQQQVIEFWKLHGRHNLPWRHTTDPYKILVSEIMLQQTQVNRVIEKYQEFLVEFPTVHMLAQASLAQVLLLWSGLGYNRRGKFLRECAISIVKNHNGKIPSTRYELENFPGIGKYTAGAVRVFAYNKVDVFLETNIRAVFIHHFFARRSLIPQDEGGFPDTITINDRQILSYVEMCMNSLPKGVDPRTWYWALMDYGAYLKKTFPNPSRKSTQYRKQSKFEGSIRQVRGAIIKQLTSDSQTLTKLCKMLPYEAERINEALKGLEKDGIVVQKRSRWHIS